MGMDHSDKELAIIILRSAFTTLNREEQDKLSVYLNASEANREKYQELIDAEELRRKMTIYANRNENQALHLQTILQRVNNKTSVYPVNFFKRYWLAAAVVLLAACAWLLNRTVKQKRAISTTIAATAKEVVPGKTGALLTLDDGSQLVLDSAGNGILATQQGAQVVLKDGQLAYDKTGAAEGKLIYNTLATPRGREFTLALPDGTRVWLNSGSSIRYPVGFASSERIVYITGEAYLEVASLKGEKGKKIPFKVIISAQGETTGIGGTEVEVLGTHFNINAYEAICKTTLLEGKVIVRKAGNPSDAASDGLVLRPGQHAVVKPHSPPAVNYSPDIDKVMAWRRGFFNFDNVGLQEVMQQLARWYDIDVEYEAGVPNILFAGELSRGMTWPGVLKALEESQVHFKTAGRKIIILP
ncbi:FecR family protein [Longitalea luteola]|uniref:FecR family protein n=1 Tax=Longitalea luteola TaxID=2812563 RepID=UPI001A96B78B|nr:FecR family protein [Longitalea luteola]